MPVQARAAGPPLGAPAAAPAAASGGGGQSARDAGMPRRRAGVPAAHCGRRCSIGYRRASPHGRAL